VLATSSTCTFTLRDEYPHLLDVDNSGLREHIELATRCGASSIAGRRCRWANCR
jgi:Fe-S oxidoreductase